LVAVVDAEDEITFGGKPREIEFKGSDNLPMNQSGGKVHQLSFENEKMGKRYSTMKLRWG
jgi:hypothetical protein